MPLAVGTRLGPFEILAPLGSGSTGEVYRACDSRLGRDVALKVLSARLLTNQEGLQRFAQEARSASALNHPNIVTIYEIGATAWGRNGSILGMGLGAREEFWIFRPREPSAP